MEKMLLQVSSLEFLHATGRALQPVWSSQSSKLGGYAAIRALMIFSGTWQ
jgi:hypothetical protein